MKRSTLVLFALAITTAVAAEPVSRYVYACRMPRAEAVLAIVDLLASHGWQIDEADPVAGTVTGSRPIRRAGSIEHYLHAAADGDSLRVIAYRIDYANGRQWLDADEDIVDPVLSHLPSLGSSPARERR